jgi:hypothetical protein
MSLSPTERGSAQLVSLRGISKASFLEASSQYMLPTPLSLVSGGLLVPSGVSLTECAYNPALLPRGLDIRAFEFHQSAEESETVNYSSDRDAFGVVRTYRLPKYRSTPLHDPEKLLTLNNITDSIPPPPTATPRTAAPIQFGPFENRSAFCLAEWYWQSSNKSFSDFQKLISILKDGKFSIPDVIHINWKAAFKSLGSNREDLPDSDSSWIQDDGWKRTPISIDIPFHNSMKDPGTKSFTVGTFHHRSIVSVIKEKITNRNESQGFHYYPYRATWKRTGDDPEVELYGEMYASQAFREAHGDVQRLPPTGENRGLERVVVALMFWSDATQLTSFGGSSLWPGYLFFGNESKHRRGEPSNHLGRHIAYFLKVGLISQI